MVDIHTRYCASCTLSDTPIVAGKYGEADVHLNEALTMCEQLSQEGLGQVRLFLVAPPRPPIILLCVVVMLLP